MPIYKPSELLKFLESLGASPKKGLSQNFLVDGNILKKIVGAADVKSEDLVLEIGSGPGSLTELLLDTGASVIAVEKDKVLAEALQRLKKEGQHFAIHCDDILEFSLESHLLPELEKGQKAKVIGNLPYHLTSPIISMLVPQNQVFSSLTFMVQEEVARRMTAIPGTSAYSSFTVFLKFFSTLRYAFFVSRNCFYPKPKVDSAVVILDLKPPPQNIDENQFFKMTRTAFEHRRKMLRGSLRDLYPSSAVTDALIKLNINPQARPEDLSLDQFLSLYTVLSSKS